MTRLVCIGECMLELSGALSDAPSLGFGGDTLNTAVYAARTAAGAIEVAYATALGDDPFSDHMLAGWRSERLATDLVRRLPGRLPGFYAIETDAAGERRFFYWREQAAVRSLLVPEAEGRALLARITAADLVYFSGITLAILDAAQRRRLLAALDEARGRGLQVAYDSNVRPALWPDLATAAAACAAAAATADIALVSFDDEKRLAGDADPAATAARLAGLGADEVVVKRGEGGVVVHHEGASTAVPAEPAPAVVDTTAAGDSFNGAYLARRLLGADPVTAARAGVRLASHVVRHRGALIPLAAMPGRA